MKQEIKLLKKWLEKNKASYLAFRLGYEHSTVVTNWIQNDSIPRYQIDRVMEIINETFGNNSNRTTEETAPSFGLRAGRRG